MLLVRNYKKNKLHGGKYNLKNDCGKTLKMLTDLFYVNVRKLLMSHCYPHILINKVESVWVHRKDLIIWQFTKPEWTRTWILLLDGREHRVSWNDLRVSITSVSLDIFFIPLWHLISNIIDHRWCFDGITTCLLLPLCQTWSQ